MSPGVGTLSAFPVAPICCHCRRTEITCCCWTFDILVNIQVGDPSGAFEAVIVRICETQVVYKIQAQILKETAESQFIKSTPVVMIPENSRPAKPMRTAEYQRVREIRIRYVDNIWLCGEFTISSIEYKEMVLTINLPTADHPSQHARWIPN